MCDTLLRLAEPPRFYEPKWSEEIILETTRTLEDWVAEFSIAHLEAELRAHFSDAWINGYESLISQMTNDKKEIGTLWRPLCTSNAPIIVTFNLRYFNSGTS